MTIHRALHNELMMRSQQHPYAWISFWVHDTAQTGQSADTCSSLMIGIDGMPSDNNRYVQETAGLSMPLSGRSVW